MENPDEDLYPCIGICTIDPESGYCLGCGRPPEVAPASVIDDVQKPQPEHQDRKTDQ